MDKLEFSKVYLGNIDKRLKQLDDFNEFYGWEVFQECNDFILFDSQCREIIDLYHSKYELIDRICGRALDYWIEEHEWEDDTLHISDYNMIKDLLFIHSLYLNDSIEYNGDKRWYEMKLKWLKEMKVYE